jgi:hypothetical protein
MDTRTLSIIGLLLVIFIAAMLANNGVVGYSSAKTLHEYPYEGFAEIQEKFEERKEKKEAFGPMDEFEKKKFAEAFTAKKNDKKNDKKEEEAFGPMGEKKKYAEAFEPMDEYHSPAIKVSGFKGLQSRAYDDEKMVGFMYNNEGSPTCKPFGYTNSKGNICLSGEDIKLLTTRGGNAMGKSDQIGK